MRWLLYWAQTREDAKYFWEPQMVVLKRKARARDESRRKGAADY